MNTAQSKSLSIAQRSSHTSDIQKTCTVVLYTYCKCVPSGSVLILDLKMFYKHTPHASCRQRALPSPRHPPAVTAWSGLLLADVILQHMVHALQCIVNGDDAAVFPFCPWWPWPLTLTFKLVLVTDQIQLPCKFGTNLFSRYWDIWVTNKKQKKTYHRQC